MFVKMESTQLEAGNINHLQNVLFPTEIENIPQEVASKINNYIDHKLEECSSAQAHNGTTKCDIGEKLKAPEVNNLEVTAKYNDTAKKLLTAEKTATELENQVIFISSDLELAQDKIKQLERDIISFKIARDTAINEKNDLTRILQRRDTEIDRLTASEAVLSQQLRAAIDAKCDTMASNGDVLSKELVLQYREKHMEGERNLLNSQIANLNEEVLRLTSKLQTDRLDNTSRLINLETQLAEKLEELTVAKKTISQLNEAKKALNNRIESLTQRLIEQREVESKMKENYNKELDAKNKVNDMMRGLCDDAESKAAELTDGVRELQKLLNESVEKYGVLETKYKQADVDHEELIKKKNEVISRLNIELEHANDSLRTAQANNLNKVISEFAPTAATANKLFKSGMSLTQVYSQLVNVTDELSQEKEENKKLNSTINAIVQEIEEKAPTLRKQKMDYEEALERNIALSQELELLTSECNKLRDDYTESSKIADCYNRENTVLKGELADLGKQVCFLLKELEHSRSGLMPNGDHDSSTTESTANSLDVSSSRMNSKNLVTFSDIQELQSNNQKLLRIVRDLTEKQEEFECLKEQFEIGKMETNIEFLKNRVSELTEAQDRHLKMINDLIRDRDMFKQLYHDLMKGKHELSADEAAEREKSGSFTIESSPNNSTKLSASSDKSSFEIKYIETEKYLELIKQQFKTYKEEKVTKEKMLFDKIDKMRQEILKLTDINSKITSNAEYNNDRIHILQTNITTYTNRITSLEEKNKAYNATIAKQEVALQHIRDEAVKAQNKLAAAEIQVENLKMENKLLKDAELRLQIEKEMLDRGRQGQSLLLTNLELIKASLERVEAENRVKLETRLDEANLESSVLRRRLQEEQDRFRELASHLERQTETAKSTMQEEKLAADLLRKEINDMRNELADKSKENEELLIKLKVALESNTEDSFDTVKRIRDLENKLSDKQKELNSVNEQLTVAKEHIKQYCEISECTQNELEGLHAVHNEYKLRAEAKIAEYANKLQNLEDKSSELEAELLLHTNGEHSNSNAKLKIELSNIKEELKAALANIDTYRNDLESVREENKKLSEVAQKAEEKYLNEMILHSADIQALTQVKEDLSKARNQLNEFVASKDSTLEILANENTSWAERQTILMSENGQLSQRLMDLNEQNTLLHDQITALGTQLSISYTSRSQTEVLESSVVASMNVSVSEDNINSSEQLFQMIKFLRKEKDMAMVKFDILQAETLRLKSLLEITEKQLDEAKLALAAEMERSEVSIVSVNKQSEILRKVETMNALSDSNRILREERNTLTQRIEEMSDMVKKLEEELTPLQEKIFDLTSKNETLQSENMALKADCSSWRTRVNDLIERANKIKSEDWKRLQNERETLAKMLSREKENVKKLNEELGSVKVEKAKLEEQYIELSRQQNNLLDENKKLSEEVQMLKDDLSRSIEEFTKTKAEFAVITELNIKLTKDLTNKDASLSDIHIREMQLRKIAKKYKTQYEDLVKAVQEEQKKAESEESAVNALTESTKILQEQINELQANLETEKKNTENLKHELKTLTTTNLDREERSKQVLKQAKVKIVQLTEKNHSLSRELDETRTKLGAMEQSTRDEHDVRLAAISSQYEGRVARLEKEFGELQAEKARELDVLAQKVTVLQRQLASQASAAKQQATTEKTTAGPPTANIKPMAGVAQQSVGELPLASIRPMTQAGSTAPQSPRDSSRSPSCASLDPSAPVMSAAPTDSTQDMDTSEAGTGSPRASDCNAQSSSHSQAPQQVVAMVLPRIVTPSVDASATAASASASPVAAISATPATTQPGSACEASTQAVGIARASKRRLSAHDLAAKRTKAQEFERPLEVEYLDDEEVILVESEDEDVPCTGAMYREGDEGVSEEGESEEEQEVETSDDEEEEEESESDDDDNAGGQDSPVQSPVASETAEESGVVAAGEDVVSGEGEVGGSGLAAPQPDLQLPTPRIEAISSGTEPRGTLSLGGDGSGGDEGVDGIVPSTPTLYEPKRNDGFGGAAVSPVGGSGSADAGSSGVRCTFAVAGEGAPTTSDVHHIHPGPATAMFPTQPDNTEGESRNWEGFGAEEDSSAVSSQGSESSSPYQMAEEGHELEPPVPRRYSQATPYSHPNQRWIRGADSESSARGWGGRPRGRPPRRSRNNMRL